MELLITHKKCGGVVDYFEGTCAIQLRCAKCNKLWEALDSIEDIKDPEDRWDGKGFHLFDLITSLNP